jgi:hypothetical protein
MHRGDSDAVNPNFWRKLVSSDPASLVAKGTAIFAVRTLLLQVLGFKAHRAEVSFTDDPTLEEVFSRLEQLGDGLGRLEFLARLVLDLSGRSR